uniref:Uncharacterized protein n=1 Tax=Lepeophtheirus salmonis TaxID=72036 RepID=A0A0K2UJ75_LEPSM
MTVRYFLKSEINTCFNILRVDSYFAVSCDVLHLLVIINFKNFFKSNSSRLGYYAIV